MTDTTNTVNALEAALEAAADGDMVGSLLDPRDLAEFVVTTLTALGAVMPDEAAKLRATAAEHSACAARLGESWAYGDGLEAKRDRLRAELERIRADREQVRVFVVLDKRRGTVHGITCDQDKAQRWTRALIAKAGGDNLAATMTVGLVTPNGPESVQEVPK